MRCTRRYPLVATIAAMVWGSLGCFQAPSIPSDAIVVGVALPFSGSEAAVGRNLEQALLLAVERVNEAGGIDGRPMYLLSRDSNSGSDRGLSELESLLADEEIAYLIGPEEISLASAVVPDVKARDVLNIMPGFSSPTIRDTGSRGAWVRLAPSAEEFAVAVGTRILLDGATRVNAVVQRDDYYMVMAAELNLHILTTGGVPVTSVTVASGEESYLEEIEIARDAQADATVLIAQPRTAATVIREWSVTGANINWYLAPMLHNQMFLENIPFGVLDGTLGISPSLSFNSECTGLDIDNPLGVACVRNNADSFSAVFASRWNGDQPLAAAHFYYDGLILLALALQDAAVNNNSAPTAHELRAAALAAADREGERFTWDTVDEALQAIGQGVDISYSGAATEYEFDEYGISIRELMDTWTIENHRFQDGDPIVYELRERDKI